MYDTVQSDYALSIDILYDKLFSESAIYDENFN